MTLVHKDQSCTGMILLFYYRSREIETKSTPSHKVNASLFLHACIPFLLVYISFDIENLNHNLKDVNMFRKIMLSYI